MKNIDKSGLITINFLFIFFPISIILGNFYTNLNIVLLCIFSLIFYNREIIKFKINFFDKSILLFFCYTFLVLIVNIFQSYFSGKVFSELVVTKTFFYLRYLFLYLILRVLISQRTLRLDWFSLACAISATLVCLDIFIQYYFGKDVFGIEPFTDRHFSAVFGNELIAGGYLLKFSLFCFFLPIVLNKQNPQHKIIIQAGLFIFFLLGIILSGNRMPFILFILTFFSYLLIDKKTRKFFLIFFSILFLAITFFIFNKFDNKTSLSFRMNAGNFYLNGKYLVNSILAKDFEKKEFKHWMKPYVVEIFCAKHNWKENRIFGGGIRSYRTTVNHKNVAGGCGSHPHNYYFEILSDLGLVGFVIILIFILAMLYGLFIKKTAPFEFNLNSLNRKALPFIFIFLIEFFPLRTSGSFFSTGNASVIFVILAILVSLISKKKLSNY